MRPYNVLMDGLTFIFAAIATFWLWRRTNPGKRPADSVAASTAAPAQSLSPVFRVAACFVAGAAVLAFISFLHLVL